jgi:hypothetical protein
MRRVLLAEAAILAELQLVGSVLFVFGGRVIALLALGASQGNDVPHKTMSSKAPLRLAERGDNLVSVIRQ